ncbi:HIT family protein [Microbulbifer sp. MKSA007]|uniref:HIT family protein n=1 Tax=Microbulbifer sp. TRSA007 TaxID=3243384 RepID=UPI002B2F6788|nr:HIT family protein [Microbulbifer sp. MKSA007]
MKHACLAVNPRQRSKGALLVIPSWHTNHFTACDSAVLSDVSNLILTGVDILREAFQPDGIHTFCNSGVSAGQSEDHMHVQIIPRYADEPYSFVPSDEIPLLAEDKLAELVSVLLRRSANVD